MQSDLVHAFIFVMKHNGKTCTSCHGISLTVNITTGLQSGSVSSYVTSGTSSKGHNLDKIFRSQWKQPAESTDVHLKSQAPKSQSQGTFDDLADCYRPVICCWAFLTVLEFSDSANDKLFWKYTALTIMSVEQWQKQRPADLAKQPANLSQSPERWDGTPEVWILFASTGTYAIIFVKSFHFSISQFPLYLCLLYDGKWAFPAGTGSHSGPLGATEIQKHSNIGTPQRLCSCSICRQSHLIKEMWIMFE